MRYYAYLKQKGEGCDYTIGCGNTLREFEANDDFDASQILTDIIREEYTGDYELRRVVLFRDPIPFDVRPIYVALQSEKETERNRMKYLKDKDEYERLKKIYL